MKKLGRDPEKLETLNLFSLLRSGDGSALYDPKNRQSFLEQVDAGLTRALESEATLHGIRVQSMFKSMMASFGGLRLLKEEDAGDCYFTGDDILLPDFRIVTGTGESLLVETKNHFSKDAISPFRIQSADLQALQRYSAVVGVSLRIAIYWAPWNLWSLNDPDRFVLNGNYWSIGLMQAMKQNEMAALGDFSIGTTYPFTLRLVAAADKPRESLPNGIVTMTFREVELRSADVLISDKEEQNVALYLMMYGKWQYDGGRVEFDETGLPAAVVHTVSPPEITPDQGFEIIGSLSSL